MRKKNQSSGRDLMNSEINKHTKSLYTAEGEKHHE
jgi:hypothetical protein